MGDGCLPVTALLMYFRAKLSAALHQLPPCVDLELARTYNCDMSSAKVDDGAMANAQVFKEKSKDIGAEVRL